MKDSVIAFNQMMLKASNGLQKIQSASGTSAFLDSLMSVAPHLSGADAPHLIWQIPVLYQTQSERMLQAFSDTAGVLSRAHQAIAELTAQSLSRTVQPTVKAMTRVNETLASRRVSAEIIDFADRREKAQAISKRNDDASDEQAINYPIARKAAG